MPEHNSLTGGQLHEPKGIAAADAEYVYVADGAGGGNWEEKIVFKPSVWEDIVTSLVARRLDATTGKLQYSYLNNSIQMEPSGILGTAADTLVFNHQVPHGFKAGSEMRLHIHWEQSNSQVITWSGRYRIQNNGVIKNTIWTNFSATSAADSVFTYISGTFNQITDLVQVDLTSAEISSTVQFQLARTDSTATNIEAVFVDSHVEFDTAGSREEYAK